MLILPPVRRDERTLSLLLYSRNRNLFLVVALAPVKILAQFVITIAKAIMRLLAVFLPAPDLLSASVLLSVCLFLPCVYFLQSDWFLWFRSSLAGTRGTNHDLLCQGIPPGQCRPQEAVFERFFGLQDCAIFHHRENHGDFSSSVLERRSFSYHDIPLGPREAVFWDGNGPIRI